MSEFKESISPASIQIIFGPVLDQRRIVTIELVRYMYNILWCDEAKNQEIKK